MKVRETLNRSHHSLNATRDNTGLTESFLSTELCNAYVGIKIVWF
jgi:hypothetical protein